MPPVILKLDNCDSRILIVFPLLSPFSLSIPLFSQRDKATVTSPKAFLSTLQSSVQPKHLYVPRRSTLSIKSHASIRTRGRNGAKIAWFKQVLYRACAHIGRRRFVALAGEATRQQLSSYRDVPISCDRHKSSSPTKDLSY